MRYFFITLAFVALTGCASVSKVVATVAQATSTATPDQVNTLGAAVVAADEVTKAVDVYATTGHPSKAVAMELNALSDSVHAALVTWEGANANGQSLYAASFNAALHAFNAYAAEVKR